MSLPSFEEWIAQQQESSAFTRLRRSAALGLMPPIAPAAIHSRSTAHPFEVEVLKVTKGKPEKKKAAKKKPAKKKK